jgi:hypothetical protein
VSLTARIYIAFTIAAGAVVLGYGLFFQALQDLPRFVCYLLLAMAASCLKVPVPGVTGTMSVLFLFLLAGIVELGLPETLMIGTISVLLQSFWHAKVRPRVIQIVFSLANISLAITATYFTYHAPWRFVAAESPRGISPRGAHRFRT